MADTTTTVRELTEKQAASLKGQLFAPNSVFNPMIDDNGTWIISNEEALLSKGTSFEWLYTTTEIPFVAPPFSMDL